MPFRYRNLRVILDESFLESLSVDDVPLTLGRLVENDCRLILIDNLALESAIKTDKNRWRTAQERLMAYPEAVECWVHVDEMLKFEATHHQPYGSPFVYESTRRMRAILRSGHPYVPEDVRESVRGATEPKVSDSLALKEFYVEFIKSIWDFPATQEFLSQADVEALRAGGLSKPEICRRFVNDPSLIRAYLDRILPFESALENDRWAGWHHAKSSLAWLAEELWKGPSLSGFDADRFARQFLNSKRNRDYLISLAFADAIATNEKDTLRRFARWMFGNSKMLISKDDLLKEGLVETVRRPFPFVTQPNSTRRVVPNIELPTDQIQALCRRFHVRELAIFGSVLRDDFRDGSDVDFLVEFDPEAAIGLIDLGLMGEELRGLMGRRVDLVVKKDLKPPIRREVLSSAKVIYAA
jgi:uncharacterized protein